MRRRMRRYIERDVCEAVRFARSHTWQRIYDDNPDSLSFRITVAPDLHSDRWNWDVSVVVGGRLNCGMYSEGGPRWSTGPCHYRGTTKDAAAADIAVREVQAAARTAHAAAAVRPLPATWTDAA